MAEHVVVVPRINANEDEVRVVEVLVRDGEPVKAGQHILTVESTKAASEIMADVDGSLLAVHAGIGAMIEVGQPLYTLKIAQAVGRQSQSSDGAGSARPGGGAPSVSAKARKRAKELNVDLDAIAPVEGRVTAEMVEAAAFSEQPAGTPARTAVVLDAAPSERAVMIGAGGHAATLLDALMGSGIAIAGLIDDNKPVGHRVLGQYEVVGGMTALAALRDSGITRCYLGVGGAEDSRARARLYEQCKSLGFVFPPIIARNAAVSVNAVVGEASVVLAGGVIGPNARIGRNSIVNHNATVCHDSVIGDHCHLTPGATIAGGCSVGDHSVIGMCATVLFGVRIGRGCLVHNTANVIANLPDGKMQLRDGSLRDNG